MRILRVMNPRITGHQGPYSDNDDDSDEIKVMKELFRYDHDDAWHPVWDDEPLTDARGRKLDKPWGHFIPATDALAGFANRQQYLRWFNSAEREMLRENGFTLHQLEVPARGVLMGRHQVIFDGRFAGPAARAYI